MNRALISVGNPPSPERLYIVLLSFIDQTIDGFRPLTAQVAEDAITADLSRYLDILASRWNLPFVFVNQDLRADIGVHGRAYTAESRNKFCWIEAKRLPTPNEKNRDEREYVFVDHAQYKGNGGIERFKLNKHGKGLPISIMFGYMQEGDFDFWLEKVNSWLGVYSTTDPFHCLEYLQEHNGTPGRYYSRHERYSVKDHRWISPFELYHFWIKV